MKRVDQYAPDTADTEQESGRMISVGTLPSVVQALVVVGVVLVEAVALYAGYGVLERVIAPRLLNGIEMA